MRQRGFTLLEVLAAVAILGILYVVLADVAMQGLLSEGRSRRRLEASLLADQALSDIEIEMASGGPPNTQITIESTAVSGQEVVDALGAFVDLNGPLPPHWQQSATD